MSCSSSNVPVASATFDYVSGIAIDPAGHIYVVDFVLREINIGMVKSLPVPPRSLSIAALAIDGAGNFFFTVPGSNLISELDASGQLTTYAGSSTLAGFRPGRLPVSLSNPEALTIAGNGLAVTMNGAVATIH